MNIGNTKPQYQQSNVIGQKQAPIDRVMEAIERYVDDRIHSHEHNYPGVNPDWLKFPTLGEDTLDRSRDELRAALREYVEYEK